jgi:epoxyqueuosine reductase QueG
MEQSGILNEIDRLLNKMEIPLAGISGVEEPHPGPAEFSPRNLLKDCRSVLCFGVPIPKGVLLADNDALALYWRYCNMLYRSLDTTANQLCLLLERTGHRASPIYGCYPWKAMNREFWGLLPLVTWGERTGLGGITRSGLLAHPDFGTRFLLGGVVTTAELEPSAKRTEDPCPADCLACVSACPVKAIGASGKVDHNLCIRHSGANPLLTHLLKDPLVKERFPIETIMNTVAVDDHGVYLCFECLRVCPLNSVG